jgi:hypothetical protein
MRNFRYIAILSLLMAHVSIVTSCSKDEDILQDVEASTTYEWFEPFHSKGASSEQVKDFMSAQNNVLSLTEHSSAYGTQLVYSDQKSAKGIVYSFSIVDNGLYSVIDTEPKSIWYQVQEYLQEHYSFLSSSSDGMMFTTTDKSTVVKMTKVSDEYFNLTYNFVR